MVSNIAETLVALGPRPDRLAVKQAREALAAIDGRVSKQLEECAHSNSFGEAMDSEIAEIEDAAETEKLPYKTTLWFEQLYESYEAMLKNANSCPEGKAVACVGGKQAHLAEMSCFQLNRLSCDPTPFRTLTTLNLSKKNFEVLPDFFDELEHLKVLNLSGNALRLLPESLARRSSLVELDLSFNHLEFLPSTFGTSLPNLEKLFLQLNKLSALTPTICCLSALVQLEVHFNKLVLLPPNLGKLHKLKILNASGNFNNLTSLPDSIGYAMSLEYLDLSYNQITRLPLSFGYLTRLRDLKLLQNPLVFPPLVVAEHSTKAVVEYMGEQLSNSLAIEQDTIDRLQQSGTTMSKGGLLFFLPKSSWIAELLGGMCRSTSLILGGSSTKFVGLRSHSEAP